MKIDKVKKEISPKEGKEKRKKINQTTILLKKNFSTDRQTRQDILQVQKQFCVHT